MQIPLLIHGWDALTPAGVGRNKLKDHLAARLSGELAPWTGSPGVADDPEALSVPEFSAQTILGSKGIRDLDRSTTLTIAAAKGAIEDCAADSGGLDPNCGVIVGTATGCVKSMTNFTRDTFEQKLPYLVNPAFFPNTVINCAAGRSAIWFHLKGPNVTISNSRLSFYSALSYAQRAFYNEYAKAFVLGATEEVSPQSAWAYRSWAQSIAQDDRSLAEVSAMFVVSPGGQEHQDNLKEARYELLAVENRRVHQSSAIGSACVGMIKSLLAKSAVRIDELDFVCGDSSSQYPLRRLEKMLRQQLQLTAPLLCPEKLFGDAFSAAGALQLAVLLSCLDQAAESRLGLMFTVDEDGGLAAAVVRKREHA